MMYFIIPEWLLGSKNQQAAPVAKDPENPPLEKRLIATVHHRCQMVSITSPISPTEVTVC